MMTTHQSRGKTARGKGALKKRRRHRAWRREATREVRENHNERMRAEEHPGWVQPPKGNWW